MENPKAKDPLTGELFTPKRSNQIYASRTNQIKFNNEKQKKNRKENAGINHHISNNKNILKATLNDAKEIIKSRDFLLGAGYQFAYFTHTIQLGSQWAYCCYKYCILKLPNEQFKIFKND